MANCPPKSPNKKIYRSMSTETGGKVGRKIDYHTVTHVAVIVIRKTTVDFQLFFQHYTSIVGYFCGVYLCLFVCFLEATHF